MISPLPGVTTLSRARPPSRSRASAPRSSTTTATRSPTGGGYLTLTRPWPSMLRGIYGDPERYKDTYWSRFEGRYFAGDGAKLDDDGYFWLLGRVDDVMNVSGHRISTTEVESALVDHHDGGRGGGGRRQGRRDRPGDHRLRDPARAASRPSDRPRRGAAQARRRPRSAPSPGRRRSSSPPTCPRPAAARSCAASCATSPRAGSWATPPPWPTPPSSRRSATGPRPRPGGLVRWPASATPTRRARSCRADHAESDHAESDHAESDHVGQNRSCWNELAAGYAEAGRRSWASATPTWGVYGIEERRVLDEVAGLDVVELGCGTAYVSAWLVRRGARSVVGLDPSPAQLATARQLQQEFGLQFPLVQADAERLRCAPGRSTWPSRSTGRPSGAIPTAGSPKRPACCGRAGAWCSSATPRSSCCVLPTRTTCRPRPSSCDRNGGCTGSSGPTTLASSSTSPTAT